MASIGQIVEQTSSSEVLKRARQRAVLVPDCMVEAKRIANTVIAGWHGRRKRGIGENFWQFRPYSDGESFARIDWRRSARDDHTYIRDREWEAAHTVWLWADMSPSMMYKSSFASVSKESRAVVLMLALAEILARSGERIGCPGIMEPISARNAAERLATAIMHAPLTSGLPDTRMIRGASDIVLFGDFLNPVPETLARLQPLSQRLGMAFGPLPVLGQVGHALGQRAAQRQQLVKAIVADDLHQRQIGVGLDLTLGAVAGDYGDGCHVCASFG